jgi:hypothetical protein
MTTAASAHRRWWDDAFREGSVLIERYVPDTGKPQWLVYIVRKGDLRMLGVHKTRHDALVCADGIRG